MPSLFDQGKHFFDKQQYDQAIRYFLRCSTLNTESDQDKANSLYKLGYMFRHKLGTQYNIDMAISYYKKSAILGNTDAMFVLGCIYDTGKKVPKNHKEAFIWYRQGALLGNKSCQVNLAGLYDSGEGVEQNSERAFFWFNKASIQGDIDATYNIGVMYDNGEFVDQNMIIANRYYCDAGEYNITDNVVSCEIQKTSNLNLCPHQKKTKQFDLNGMCEKWISTNI